MDIAKNDPLETHNKSTDGRDMAGAPIVYHKLSTFKKRKLSKEVAQKPNSAPKEKEPTVDIVKNGTPKV